MAITHIKTCHLLGVLPLLLLLTGIGLGDYNSPIAFALAAVCFFMFARIKLTDRYWKFLNFLGPSMFSVYLLHTNEVGVKFITYIRDYMLKGVSSSFGCAFLTACCVFVACVLLDMPRRMAVATISLLRNRDSRELET